MMKEVVSLKLPVPINNPHIHAHKNNSKSVGQRERERGGNREDGWEKRTQKCEREQKRVRAVDITKTQ